MVEVKLLIKSEELTSYHELSLNNTELKSIKSRNTVLGDILKCDILSNEYLYNNNMVLKCSYN